MRNLGWIEAEGEPDGVAIAEGGYLRAIVEDAAVGRTTRDGISLEQILHDRPDVFAAYFQQFHGPNNDHHSDAWAIRIGGDTIQDYANYWYERHGKWGDYVPRAADPIGGAGEAQAPAEDPEPPPEAAPRPDDLADDGVLSVGRALSDPGSELFG